MKLWQKYNEDQNILPEVNKLNFYFFFNHKIKFENLTQQRLIFINSGFVPIVHYILFYHFN